MKLLYFRESDEGEFIVLCDDKYLKETIKEYSDDATLIYVGSVDRESGGTEDMLPTDRILRQE